MVFPCGHLFSLWTQRPWYGYVAVIIADCIGVVITLARRESDTYSLWVKVSRGGRMPKSTNKI